MIKLSCCEEVDWIRSRETGVVVAGVDAVVVGIGAYCG